ncbi:MAG TPA: Crp/Fnr family transcriptional regulator [Terriglobales bacterium]
MPAPVANPYAARMQQLRRIPMFAPLEPAPLAALAQRSTPHHYLPGDLLFQEGDTCAGVFVITEGTVRIFKLSPSGRELMLHQDQAPATVAEVPLVDGGPYPASVRAVSEVEALFLERQAFLNVCRQHPDVALESLAVFGRRMRNLVGLLEAVTFGGVRQRLARMLLDQSGCSTVRGKCRVTATHQELALAVGTVREVVSRNLSRFQAEGLVRLQPRTIELLNPDGLRHEAELEM